jgi:hypothetical protein
VQEGRRKPQEALRAAEVQNPLKAHPRIFVVDDELSIAKMMSVILQMNLFDAVPFADPKSALDAARVNPPDYLISDIAMQGMTVSSWRFFYREKFPAAKFCFFRTGGRSGNDSRCETGGAQLCLLAEANSPQRIGEGDQESLDYPRKTASILVEYAAEPYAAQNVSRKAIKARLSSSLSPGSSANSLVPK